MTDLLSLLPLLLTLAVYLGALKLAALLYRRTRLNWARGAAFTLVAIVVPAIVGLGITVSGLKAPYGLLAAIGVGVQVMLGGLVLGRIAATREGVALGFAHGAILSAIHLVMMAVLFVLPSFVFMWGVSR
jgi:hypothetical protein